MQPPATVVRAWWEITGITVVVVVTMKVCVTGATEVERDESQRKESRGDNHADDVLAVASK